MNEIKGRFIMLVATLVGLYPDKQKEADAYLIKKTGLSWKELDPEGWYDIVFFRKFMEKYVEGSPTKERALITLGKKIYPTIKKTYGFPPNVKTPLDYIKFEAEGYATNIRGPEIKPREFIKAEEGEVIVRLAMKEQDCKVLEGVYEGIFKLAGIKTGKVEQTKCVKKGDPYCEFKTTW